MSRPRKKRDFWWDESKCLPILRAAACEVCKRFWSFDPDELVSVGWLRTMYYQRPDTIQYAFLHAKREMARYCADQLARRRPEKEIPAGFDPPAKGRDIGSLIDAATILAKLPAKDRDVILGRYAKGMTASELGRKYGQTRQAIDMRRARVLRRINKQLSAISFQLSAGKISADSGERTAESRGEAANSYQLSAIGSQQEVSGGQRTAESGQRKAAAKPQTAISYQLSALSRRFPADS